MANKMKSKKVNSRFDFRIRERNIAKSKRSQITVFIIIGVVIVAGVVFYFLMIGKKVPVISRPVMSDPEAYIEKCAKDAAIEAIGIMLPQGGYINPQHYKLYKNNKIQYLCYTNLFYRGCINQEPLYTKHLQDEITNYIFSRVEECFFELETGLEEENYGIEMSQMKIDTELGTGYARINIDRKFTMTKQGETRKIEKFSSVFNSPLYNLAIVAVEIANQESKYCNFEYVGFMLLYPEFNIDKKAVGSGKDSSKIYIIGDKYSGKKLNIAIRSCAFPESF